VTTAARRCAFDVVGRVLDRGAYGDIAFRAEAARYRLSGRERAFAMRLAYGTIQRRATLDYLIEHLTDRPAEALDPPLRDALRLGLYQLAYLGGVADHAAVDESVELAKQGGRGGHRLVNAALRRGAQQASDLLESLGDASPTEAALLHSHPAWITELWWRMLGREEALLLMERNNEPPESAVRANTLKTTPDELIGMLAGEQVRARTDALVAEAVVLEEPYDVHGSPLYERGALMPQARASMLVAHAVDPVPGEAVLDLCAAPGAKTTHLAALMRDEGRIVAVDLDPGRAEAVAANCKRLGIRSVETRVGDATKAVFGQGYDRVLVDPPCSDLGTLQSRPDARWRKRPEQVEELHVIQAGILEAAAQAVRPGGRLVYSSCTISERENEGQVADFLGRHDDFSPHDLSEAYPHVSGRGGSSFVQTLPHRDGTDGFFIAALQRSS
jgi:16S rRNA (cytosine967-C5)-methyltransferase